MVTQQKTKAYFWKSHFLKHWCTLVIVNVYLYLEFFYTQLLTTWNKLSSCKMSRHRHITWQEHWVISLYTRCFMVIHMEEKHTSFSLNTWTWLVIVNFQAIHWFQFKRLYHHGTEMFSRLWMSNVSYISCICQLKV